MKIKKSGIHNPRTEHDRAMIHTIENACKTIFCIRLSEFGKLFKSLRIKLPRRILSSSMLYHNVILNLDNGDKIDFYFGDEMSVPLIRVNDKYDYFILSKNGKIIKVVKLAVK